MLESKELVETTIKLRDELSKDFSESLLEECDKCSAGLDTEIAKRMHLHLITIFNELKVLKNILVEKKLIPPTTK